MAVEGGDQGTEGAAAAAAAAATAAAEAAAAEGGEGAEGSGSEMDWQAEAEKWKALSRKNEQTAKTNAKAAAELERVRLSQLNEQDRAIEEAVKKATEETRSATLREVGSDLVDAAVRAVAAGRKIDVEALLDGLDRSRFITDEGRADNDAIAKWIERIAPSKPGSLDLGQGARGGAAATVGTSALGQQLGKALGIS